MSGDYALFIILVPNDLIEETAVALVNAVEDLKNDFVEKEQSTPKPGVLQVLPALLGPGTLTSSTSPDLPTITNATFDETNDSANESSQMPRERSICCSLKSYLESVLGTDAVWMISDDKKTYQITFFAEFGIVSDRMLQELRRIEIGVRSGTKIFILPTSCVVGAESPMTMSNQDEQLDDRSASNGLKGALNENLTLTRKIKHKKNESDFRKSVRARLMVHQVVAAIRLSTALTFDFVILLILASMLAALGLLENSTVTIVASMLISPLMNPILGIVFGLSVREHSLWKCGLRNEIIGLLICLSCGFLLGLFTTFSETNWGSSTSFPTSEMRSRGNIRRLWIGVLIALPSGAGVALSVLGGNTGSLVGVAISASLLPPAVNCGLLFAYALLGKTFSTIAAYSKDIDDNQFQLNGVLNAQSFVKNCTKYVNNDYHPLYSCNLATEAAILGVSSFLLTIVNILCIIIMALIILRIKEVAPLNQTNDDITQFFHHDVRVARDYNKTIHQQEDAGDKNLAQTIVNKWKTFKSSSSTQQQNNTTKHPDDYSSNSNDLVSTISKNTSENNFNYFIQCHNSKRKFNRLQAFAREYDLDLYNRNDYELTSPVSREKVQIMARDLLQLRKEAERMDLSRLIPHHGINKQHQEDITASYHDLIGILPPKWNEIFLREQQLQTQSTGLSSFHRSYSLHEKMPSFQSNQTLNHSFNDHHYHQPQNSQRPSLQRLTSLPREPVPPTGQAKPNEAPKSTRFLITKANDISSI